MKLSHLLVTEALHNLDADTIYTGEMIFTDYQGPFTIHLGHKRSHIQLNRRPHQLSNHITDLHTPDSSTQYLQRRPWILSHAHQPSPGKVAANTSSTLDKLSPTSYKSRLKKVANGIQQYTLNNTFYNENQDVIHLLPSILSSNRMSTNVTSEASTRRFST
jgi:hypothetical protein